MIRFVHQDRILEEQAGDRADHVPAFDKQIHVLIPILGGTRVYSFRYACLYVSTLQMIWHIKM